MPETDTDKQKKPDALLQSWQQNDDDMAKLVPPYQSNGIPATIQRPPMPSSISSASPMQAPSIASTQISNPESQAIGSIASTPPSRERTAGRIIGDIGRGVGSAVGQFVAPWAMPFIPGTIQHQMFETGRERAKEKFQTGQEEAQARIGSENARAEFERSEALKNRRGEVPAETPEQRAARAKQYGLQEGTPEFQEYVLTGKFPTERAAGQEKLLTDEQGNVFRVPPTGAVEPLMTKQGMAPPVPSASGSVIGGIPAAPIESEAPHQLREGPKQSAAGEKLYTNPTTGKQFYGVPTGQGVRDTATNEVVKDATPYEKEANPRENKAVAGTLGGSPAWGLQTDKGWIDPETQKPIPNFKPAPSFAETGLFQPTEVVVGDKLVPGKFNARTGVATPMTGAVVAPSKEVNTEIGKIMETARGADTRYGVMIDNEKPALAGNQQAMINILANHMGMTQGLQKGSRINQAMWDEATASAPWLDRVLSKFTKTDANGDRVLTQPLTGVTLTPEQIHQMVELGQDRRVREWQQAIHTASQNGLDISGTVPQDVRAGISKVEGNSAGTTTSGTGAPAIGSDEHFNEWLKSRKK